MSEMRVVLHREIPSGEDFRRQWNALVDAMERPEVFYTWEWAQAVARVYGTSLRPLLFTSYRGETLAGVAALAQAPGGEICFLAATTADYCDFVSTSADREAWIELVMRELRAMKFAELRLANLPADSVSAPIFRSSQTLSYSIFARPAYLCAQVALHASEDRAQVSKTANHKLKRMTKAAGELRTATVEYSATLETLNQEFPEFSASHVARFLNAGEVSNLVSRERRSFLIELARLLASQGWLALSILKIEGRSIAWNYGFRFAGKWFYYQPTFDVEARRLSPGSYLLCRILQNASADSETSSVDLGLGEEGYKQQYGKAVRQTLYITASRSQARRTWQFCRYRIASIAKRSPGLEKASRNFVAALGSLRKQGIIGVVRNSASSVARVASGGPEIYFLEWVGAAPSPFPSQDVRVLPVSARLLAAAAMRYEGEPGTLQYLLRSAKRIQSGETQGFALVAADGTPLHFCWVAPFANFKMPALGQALLEPSPGAVLLFDGWTPTSQRGHGYFLRCTAMVAGLMLEKGKRPWIFRVAPNSTAGLERAGFAPRFTLARKKKLFGRPAQLEIKPNREPAMNLYPAA